MGKISLFAYLAIIACMQAHVMHVHACMLVNCMAIAFQVSHNYIAEGTRAHTPDLTVVDP